MSIFSAKKEKKEPTKPIKKEAGLVVAKKSAVKAVKAVRADQKVLYAPILLGPRITEKAHFLTESANVYVFEVMPGSNKRMISEAIYELYKVQPTKVSIVNIPRKQVLVRGRWGMRRGGKKAYVYLKKGDKLELA